MPLVSNLETVYYYDLRVAQLNSRTISPLVFHVEKVIPCFLVHPPHAISLGEKHVCNKAHHSV